jgi:hypothetical protein
MAEEPQTTDTKTPIKVAWIGAIALIVGTLITALTGLAWNYYAKSVDSKPPEEKIIYTVEVREEGTNNPISQASVTLKLGEYVAPVDYTNTQGLVRFELSKSKEKLAGRINIEKSGYDNKGKDRIVSVYNGKIEQFVLKPLN